MKRSFWGISIVFLATILAVPTVRGQAGGSWSKQYEGANITNLFVQDDKTLWAVGENGTILHSKDGGRSWQKRYEGGMGWLNSIYMVDKHLGWAVGNGGTILATNDGGKTWQRQVGAGTGDYRCVYFADETRGLIGGGAGVILLTEDGGKEWKAQQFKFASAAPDAPAAPNAIRLGGFSDASHAVVLKDNDRVMITDNGGKGWKVAGFPEGFAFEQLYVHGQSAWLGGGRKLSSGTVLSSLWVSSDAGKTWRPVNFAKLMTRTIDSLWFANEQNGIISVDGKLYRTTDGGQNWTVLYDGSEKVRHIFARDPEHIWAIIGGAIFHYESGATSPAAQAQ